jgi:uncharacterized integral membrane protein
MIKKFNNPKIMNTLKTKLQTLVWVIVFPAIIGLMMFFVAVPATH